MARRSVTFDVKVNTPSAQQEAQRVANIFSSKLSNIKVGTQAGSAGAGGGGAGGGGGGGGGSRGGMPGSSLTNLVFGSAQYAVAGMFYKFFSNLPSQILGIEAMATANKRASTSFAVLAGSAKNAGDMTAAYQRGSGGIASHAEATTSAMRLFNLGLASNSEQMQKFTTLARGMSQALGKDVGYVEEQFTLAMANQSYLRFDQLGLSVTRQKELMADLAKQYPEMTKEVVFQNAMLTQAAEKYYNLANAQEALGTSTEIATRMLEDQKEKMGGWFSENAFGPLAGDLAKAFGGTEYNLSAPSNRAYANRQRTQEANIDAWWNAPMNYLKTSFTPGTGASQREAESQKLLGQASMADSLARAQNNMQAANLMGTKIDPMWIKTLDEAQAALGKVGTNTDVWTGRINAVNTLIGISSGEVSNFGDVMLETGNAGEFAAAQLEAANDKLMGVAAGMISKLVDEGFSHDQIVAAGLTQAKVEDIATKMMDTALAHGDMLDKEEAYARAALQVRSEGEKMLDDKNESERLSKKYASEAESSAKKMATAMENAATKISDTFKSMLHNIPGLFSPSEVTESDLYLAKKGYAINKPDDWLRRLSDVALNKSKRSDVDLGLIARAVGHPEETDPMALMYLAQQGMADMSIYANPELAKQLINPDAVKAGLHGQEMSQLGTQTVEAMFGVGTPETNEYLRVFGVKALDPIKDGLISEITTKGPAMGGMIADAMHEGFTQQAKSLPWVQELMKIMTDQVGRGIAAEQNANATSDIATTEAVSNGLSYR